MTEIVELDFTSIPEREALANFINAGEGPLPGYSTEDNAGFFETAGLMWQQETNLGSSITYGFESDRNGASYDYDKKFNPIKLWYDNQDEFGDITPYIRAGMFNDVVNEKQFKDRRMRLLDEQDRRKRIANGSGWGIVAGMGLSLIDISTLVPFGWATKGKTLYKVGKMAFGAGVLTAAQETVLHMQQDLRTTEESLLNVGISVPIGGGMGVFVSALNPKSRLSPKHPENPFNKDNPIRMGIAQWGKAASESAVVQPVTKAGRRTFQIVSDSSVGAAAVKVGEVTKAGIVTKPLKLLHKATPVGRMLYARSSKARDAILKLVDTGGILTDTMGMGRAQLSAEDFKARFMGGFENIFINHVDRYNTLRMRLEGRTGGIQNEAVQQIGDTTRRVGRFFRDLPTTARGGQVERGVGQGGAHFEDFEFQDVIYRVLHDEDMDPVIDGLRQRFGDDGAQDILDTARQQADDIHAVNQMMEDAMVEAGMIKEWQRMGREYGLAQLWNPKAMRGSNRQAAIRFFMEKFLNKPTDDFLMDGWGMTGDQFEMLGKAEVKIGDETFDVARGLDQRNEILEEWSGDTFDRQVTQAEIELRIHEATYEAARREAVWQGRDLRKSETDYRKATVEEAKKILEMRIAERERAALERDRLRLEKQEIDTELARLAEEQSVRMNQFVDTGRWQRKYTAERKSEVEQSEDLLSALEKEDGGAPLADIEEARRMLTEADNELALVGDDALDAAVADAATKPVYSRVLSKLQERQRQIVKQMSRIDRRLERLDPKINKVSQAVASASDAVIRVRNGRVALRALKKEADKNVREQRRGVKKAKKNLRMQQGKLPVHSYVEDLVDTLGKQNKIPRGILESEVFVSGRTKTRKIILSNEERREAINLGLLRDDLYQVMYSSHEDISQRLALRKMFGTEDVTDVARSIRDDYDSMIANARKRGLTDRYIKSLEKERDAMTRDVQGVWERTLGMHGLPEDSEGFINWTLQKLRAWNFVKYGTGFLVSSLTDPASVALTSGFHALSTKNMRAVRKAMKGMRSDEIRRFATISERVLHNSRTLKIADASDIAVMSGIGNQGTIKHGLTSNFDRVMQGMSNTASVMSGMLWWNTRLKALGMMEMQHNLVGLMKDYDSLLTAASAGNKKAELEIAKLASIGIGEEQARRINKMMAKHEPVLDEGVYELEISRWLDEGDEGHAAHADVEFALRRVANRAVMTPGIAETPLLMSKQGWKTILQFQTYGFVVVNRFITPALQRGMTYNDMDAFMSMAFAAGLGTVVVGLKDLQRSGEIKERSPVEWAYDVLDRSGYLMYLTVPSSMAFNMANVAFGLKEAPSRFANRNQWTLFLGPSFATAEDISGSIFNLAHGDAEQAGKHAMKLVPFQILKNVGDRIIGED